MSLKSRELSFERGTPADGTYFSSSGSAYRLPEESWIDKLYTLYYEGLAAANTYAAVPVYLGLQTFSSSERPRPLFNDCFNRKLYGIEVPITYLSPSKYRVNLYSYVKLKRYGVPSMATPANIQVPYLNWSDIDEARRRAWWSMQPRFEGELSALNFLCELKDFKTIAKGLAKVNHKSIISSIRNFARNLRIAGKAVKSKTASQNAVLLVNSTTKVASEVWLTKQFAIDPTIRDCTTLHGQLASLVQEVQDEFFDRGKTAQKSHYSETIEKTESLSWYADLSDWHGLITSRRIEFTATIEYLYNYKMRPYAEALRRYYGLNLNAEVVWNALPWSFVVDYFLKVGQAIDFMNTDPNVELRTLQYCESLLGTHEQGRVARTGVNVPYVLVDGKPVISSSKQLFAGYHGSVYHRRVTSPNKGAALPRLTLPSKAQAKNLVALLRAFW